MHNLLDRFLADTASRIQRQAYNKTYKIFLADFHVVNAYVKKHLPALNDAQPAVLKPCAPSHLQRLGADEDRYLDVYKTLMIQGRHLSDDWRSSDSPRHERAMH